MMASTASFLVVIRCVGVEEVGPPGPAEIHSKIEKSDVKGVRRQAEREPIGVREAGVASDVKTESEPPKGSGTGAGAQDSARSGGSLYRSTKTLRLPDYDWIHIQETYGTVQLYRHAPRYNCESESSQPRTPRAELGGGTNRAASVTEAVSGGLLIMGDDERDQHYYTPFRSGRLSTLLVMGVPRDMPASAIMSSLSSVNAQLRSVHILRDYRSSVHHRSFLLLTLESHEAAERLHHAYNTPTPQHPLLPPPSPPADTAPNPPPISPLTSSSMHQAWDSTGPELDASSAGLPGGRSLFVSGIVLVEPEGATVLSCLRSLMGTAEGLAHQGSVQVTGGRVGCEAHCLILASQENALSFLSSLVVEETCVASKGIDSYLAELPTCLQCLDKVDPSILQVPPPPFGYYPSMSSSSSSIRRSPSAFDGNGVTCCPVCRSVQKYADGPMACNTCQIPENLWICLLCAHVGCGRYTKEHAKQHFHQTGHILSLELATGRAWDYVEDVFVHVMTTRPLGGGGGGSDETGGGGGSMQHGGGEVDKDDPQQAKLAGLAAEYNALLASQLDEQLRYYEQLLAKTAADWAQDACQDDQMTEEERREAEEARVLIRALEEEVDGLMKQLREAEEQARNMRAKNEALLEVQKRQKEQVADLKAKAAKAKEQCLAEQQDYEQQIQDLTFFLRTQEAVKASPQRDELEGGHLVVTGGEDTARTRGRGRLGRRRGR